MQAILMAIAEGTRVVGALAWSVVDNLEWKQGLVSFLSIFSTSCFLFSFFDGIRLLLEI
jgi:hypothetical protein